MRTRLTPPASIAALFAAGLLFCLPLINPDKKDLLPILVQFIHNPAFHNIQVNAASLLSSYYPEEAEAAGVYDLFPAFCRARTNAARQLDSEAASKEGVK